MGDVTITILHGADRGKVFSGLTPPLTIGREEGNSLQLHDERVSRCHLKIQRDNDRLVLTDLDSTNGTKVNGQETQLRILRYGDLIAVGRSLLLFGNEEQIAERMATIGGHHTTDSVTLLREGSDVSSDVGDDFDLSENPHSKLPGLMGLVEPPEIPDKLTPGQAAQMCEILEYMQTRLHKLIENAEMDENSQQVSIDFMTWQRLVDLQVRLATLIRNVASP